MEQRQTNRRPTQAQHHVRPRKKKKVNLAPYLILGAVVVVALGILVGCLAFKDDGKIVGNLFIAGVDLGGLTREEAKLALEANSATFGKDDMTIELYTRDFPLYTTTYNPDLPVDVDIFGKPLVPTQTVPATEVPTETEAVEETEETPEETPAVPADAPLDENGDPLRMEGTITLTAADVGISLDIDKAVEAAYDYGRGGLFSRLSKKNLDERLDLDVSKYLSVDENNIRNILKGHADVLATALSEAKVNSSTDALQITLGIRERNIDVDSLFDAILRSYTAGEYRLQYVLAERFPEPLDLDVLRASYNKEPINAVCDENTFEITEGKDGYGFDMAEAITLLDAASEGETITVPMGVLAPYYTVETLQSQLFNDELSYCETPHTNIPNRTTNLRLACAAINGYILKPGEVFSFNGIVGQRTAAKGYREGNAYVGGDTVPVIGGGICQVASTLYYCTLMADLEVVEREEHQYVPDYIKWGIDATIYWNSIDYKFRNNTPYPIRIEAWVEGGYVRARFVGTETKDYTVVLDSVTVSREDYDVKDFFIYPEMPNYEKYAGYKDGETVVFPYTGYFVKSYMYKYDKDGNELSCEFIDDSDYDSRDKQVAVLRDPATHTDPVTGKPIEPTEPTTPPATEPTTPPTTTAPPSQTEPPAETEPPVETDPPAGEGGEG